MICELEGDSDSSTVECFEALRLAHQGARMPPCSARGQLARKRSANKATRRMTVLAKARVVERRDNRNGLLLREHHLLMVNTQFGLLRGMHAGLIR